VLPLGWAAWEACSATWNFGLKAMAPDSRILASARTTEKTSFRKIIIFGDVTIRFDRTENTVPLLHFFFKISQYICNLKPQQAMNLFVTEERC
jgi:hypothetical protein